MRVWDIISGQAMRVLTHPAKGPVTSLLCLSAPAVLSLPSSDRSAGPAFVCFKGAVLQDLAIGTLGVRGLCCMGGMHALDWGMHVQSCCSPAKAVEAGFLSVHAIHHPISCQVTMPKPVMPTIPISLCPRCELPSRQPTASADAAAGQV